MSVLIDLTGKKFGKWEVLEHSASTSNGQSQWLCECAGCHRTLVVAGNNLRAGRSFGCHQCGNRLPEGEASFNSLLGQYKKDAAEKGRSFILSRDQFRMITSSPCYYCGVEPKQIWTRGKTWGHYKYNGIDRKINSRGYVPINSVPCCKKCNFMKKDMKYSEFVDWITEVYNCLQKKQNA